MTSFLIKKIGENFFSLVSIFNLIVTQLSLSIFYYIGFFAIVGAGLFEFDEPFSSVK